MSLAKATLNLRSIPLIHCRCTVVKEYNTFWVEIRSDKMSYMNPNARPENEPEPDSKPENEPEPESGGDA